MEKITEYIYALDESFIVAITDHQGIITHVNDNFCKASKYTYEELIGQDHQILNTNYPSQEVMSELWKTITNGKIWRGEFKNRAKDGSTYWIDSTIVPFINQGVKSYQYIAISSDIVDRKVEEEFIKGSYEKAIEQVRLLKLKNEQLVDFCNIISHNLRAPLINLSMLVDIVEQSDDENERKDVLSKIKPVVKYLMDDLNELVESIQVSQDTEIKLDKVDLKNCLNKVLKGFDAQIQNYNADIHFNFNQAPIIYFPQKYIESILSNLISNALKYRSLDRQLVIKIETRREDNNSVILLVKDNGMGIDLVTHKDQIFKIRKTFHKNPDAKGFGLFMTKNHVEAMKGEIWVESEPGEGSTFFIKFKSQIDDSEKNDYNHR